MNARVHQPVHTDHHAPSYYAASVNRRLEAPPWPARKRRMCALSVVDFPG